MSSVCPTFAPRLVRTIGMLAVLSLVLLLAGRADSAVAAPGDTLGVYAGAGAPDAVGAFEQRLGRDVAVVHETFSRESWDAMTDINWFMTQWGTTKYAQRVVYTVPMLPNTGGTLAEGAGGAYNEHFRRMALRLVAGGERNATLRIGPEFNGSWFRWTIAVPDGGADYAAYWRQIVTTMRAVPGANFKFDWSPNMGSSYINGQRLTAASAWPGDTYVDYVGLDVYDQSWAEHRADPAARWNEYVTQPDGLRWHRDFAAAHGKAMTFPEWGIAHRNDGQGGGDAPYFIEQMYEWIRTNNVAYSMYFEYADGDADYAVFNGRAPRAAARFVALFGAGATGAPLASLGGAPAGTTPAGRSSTTTKPASKRVKRCVSRPLKARGKLVRTKGKVMRSNGKVMRSNGKVVRRNGKVVRSKGKVVRRNGKVVRSKGKLVMKRTCRTVIKT